jgi:anti-sigma-K factor RskA
MTSLRPTSGSRTTAFDAVLVGAGMVALALSFLGYYTESVYGVTEYTNAWHGFWGWFAAVVAALAALLLLAARMFPSRFVETPYRTVLTLFLIAAGSEFGALFTSGFDTSRLHGWGVRADTGHGYAYWISLAAVVLGVGMSYVCAVHAGESQVRPIRAPLTVGGKDREG